MAALTLRKVVKRFGHVEIIHGVDLDISDGEFVVFVGPSGCGKSTLLRMIAGLEELTDGELRIGDRVVNDVEPAARGVAMVFQSYALYPHMTVEENMGFGLRMAGLPKADVKAQVARAAEVLHLTPLLTRRPAQLSGGQRQRVAIGRAIVRDPKVFLFDEPLSNLDAKMRVQMRVEISKLHSDLNHYGLRYARSGRSDDTRRQDRRSQSGPNRAGRQADGSLPETGKSLCCGFYRLSKDELLEDSFC
jgi:lactose/L-arabinose transport system ATP-binding protein